MRMFLYISLLVMGFSVAVVGAFGSVYADGVMKAVMLGLFFVGALVALIGSVVMSGHVNDLRRRPAMKEDPDEHPGITALRHRRIGVWSSQTPIDTRRGHGR